MRIRKVIAFPAILALGCALAGHAADWLNDRGDPHRAGWQTHEKLLTPANVKDLKLIWKLKLDDGAIATPAILGHWVTNRGTKELVFAVSGSNTVYAVDADLGRLSWQRHLESGTTGSPAPPVLAPGPPPPPGKDEVDEDDDVRQAIRPVYVSGASGRRYRLHPTTGTDVEQPAEMHDSLPGSAADAQWEDGWSFAAGPAGITATRNGHRMWATPRMIAPAPPVVANRVVYALSRGSQSAHATLQAYEAKTGRLLYSSGDLITSFVTASGLALANGHVCFGTHDGTLYCFGFPVDL
ncbi:MAG: PQQ-binding-like beta-propeller repeat protein [Acidobacteriota bacterium]|nr:PQQ-binding-like beta-propeller repeat protein [Acidobacteriota bacterium]